MVHTAAEVTGGAVPVFAGAGGRRHRPAVPDRGNGPPRAGRPGQAIPVLQRDADRGGQRARLPRALGVELYSSAVFCFVPEISLAFYDAVVKQDSALIDRFLGEFFHPFVRLGNQVPGYAVSLIKAGVRLRGLDTGGCGRHWWTRRRDTSRSWHASSTGGWRWPRRRRCNDRHDPHHCYLAEAGRRAKLLGLEILVFGSGAARRAPARFPPSRARRQFGAALRLAARYAHRKPSSPRNMRPRKPARMTSGAAHTGVSAVMSAPTASAVRVPVYSSLARVFEGRWFEPMAHRCLLIGADEDETTEGSVIGSQSPRPQWRPL